jgi:cytochrome c
MKALIFVAAVAWLVPQAAFAQDEAMTRGEQAFKVCGACHSVGEGATNRMGPALNDVLGAPAASRPGFAYSQSLTKMSADGLVWNRDTVTQFLHKPRDFVPGTKMAFGGIPDDNKISDIIAYLATFSPDYVPEDSGMGGTGATPPAEPPKS